MELGPEGVFLLEKCPLLGVLLSEGQYRVRRMLEGQYRVRRMLSVIIMEDLVSVELCSECVCC